MITARFRGLAKSIIKPLRLKQIRKRWRKTESDFQIAFPGLYSVTMLPEITRYRAVVRMALDKGITWEPSVIFVHVPKCGGTSVLKALAHTSSTVFYSISQIEHHLKCQRPVGSVLSLDHMSLEILIESGLINQEKLSRLASFAIIRNPWDRLVSAFRHHTERRLPYDTTFETYVSLVVGSKWPTRLRNEIGLSHAQPASEWTKPDYWNGPNKLFRLENLPELHEFLGTDLGIANGLGHYNSKKTVKHSGCYCLNSELETAVRDWYAKDFLIGGYGIQRTKTSLCPQHAPAGHLDVNP